MAFGRKRGIGDYISDGIENVSARVGHYARNKVDELLDNIEWRLMYLQDRVIKKFTYSLFFGISIVFIALGTFYLMREFFELTNTVSFLILGVILFFIGIFVKLSERRDMAYG